MWEELIRENRYSIKDTRPPALHHSISWMHFVQPGQKGVQTKNKWKTKLLNKNEIIKFKNEIIKLKNEN
jgi:hypothetical protein